jgi:hypothetical protein
MRIATYYKDPYMKEKVEIPYDENAPCLVCGEPVIGASMGGTSICGSCDCGKCRYCGTTIFVLREEIDHGESKRRVLEHMKWHHEHTPEIVEHANSGLRRLMDRLDEEQAKRNKG